MDREAEEILAKIHEGFSIRCDKCGSENVGVVSDVGMSALSGCWGGVSLRCGLCGYQVEIWEA